ncbi:sigma-70 family RNA polymerase sigma factor [Halobacillus sp. ACCC02827]|uniref:sigma-70 family RNA polymerase sigma factor n=1 Tax=unclassified Halobacillus TaxID=2636472 RepID=UPI0002A51DF8|nr:MULTISPECIES: sigma-70 family RNA polymerase sigma factor [unclassified Halobacillus]ELK48750.1 hypothetical protein D479_01677 [Halobacillus sp. BAB-2008]WJE15308.1 sigma-70 family RNA polymerase sigma factor [Halobacillus sp. ACCC02827]
MIDEQFSQLVADSKKLIHYHIRRLHIMDRNGDFFAEGMVAVWNASRTYDPAAGKWETYLSWKIRNALIDLIRKDSRTQEKETLCRRSLSSTDASLWEDVIEDEYFWIQVRNPLTDNQWKWVYHHFIHDRSLKQIACLEGVTIDAVKNWGRHARRKLKGLKLEA